VSNNEEAVFNPCEQFNESGGSTIPTREIIEITPELKARIKAFFEEYKKEFEGKSIRVNGTRWTCHNGLWWAGCSMDFLDMDRLHKAEEATE
jgi:hypothetical protein